MGILIFSIGIVYGVSALLLHLIFRLRDKSKSEVHRIYIITNNNELQIEWYIRKLFLKCLFKGISIYVILIDEGSTDDTLKIVERLKFIYQGCIFCYPQDQFHLSIPTQEDGLKWETIRIKEN
jgi:hypothetical protein